MYGLSGKKELVPTLILPTFLIPALPEMRYSLLHAQTIRLMENFETYLLMAEL